METSAKYLNYKVVKNIVATTISFSLSVDFFIEFYGAGNKLHELI